MSLLTADDIKITYGKLDKMLVRLGYKQQQLNGAHYIYSNKSSLVAIKRAPKNYKVPRIVVSSVVTNILNSKIANPAKIRAAYEAVENS
ncbi:MAG: hypothetical protein QM764_20855 [Chitinophagaceae bacterium]